MSLLEIDGLTVSYGGLRALTNVSLTVPAGGFVSVIGANGAGKSTLFRAISGVVSPDSGTIRYRGVDLLQRKPADRAQLGIAHVPEGRQVFNALTVLENIEMGAYARRAWQRWNRSRDRIFALFPVLAERRRQIAGMLSGGQQQMLAIARGLACDPDLLMLDEPSMGLAPAIVDDIFDRVASLCRDDRLTVLLVEQRAADAVECCDYGYVIETGRIVHQGAREALMSSSDVRRAYFGL
jgi:branched-chain amino acid transport system ATP-binding protein